MILLAFVGEAEFLEFGYPYLKELYGVNAGVKLFHNDADCAMSLKYYPELGINLYNPGIQMTAKDLIEGTKHKTTILGNVPPRDVLAAGSPQDVKNAVKELLASMNDTTRLMLSCGGGMPPAVSTENIRAFISSARN
jgi:uroporphyrinogen-III decarboxylase